MNPDDWIIGRDLYIPLLGRTGARKIDVWRVHIQTDRGRWIILGRQLCDDQIIIAEAFEEQPHRLHQMRCFDPGDSDLAQLEYVDIVGKGAISIE